MDNHKGSRMIVSVKGFEANYVLTKLLTYRRRFSLTAAVIEDDDGLDLE
jgi:hypothetical protein